MKRILFIILLLGAVNLFAQAPLIPSVRCSLTVVNTFTDPYTVTGKTVDFLSEWDATDIAAGDSLYLLDGSQLRVYRVASISSASGTNFTISIDDINNSGNIPVTGIYGAFFRGTTNFEFPNWVAGVSEQLNMAIQNRFVQRLDDLLNLYNSEFVTTDSFTTFIGRNNNTFTYSQIPIGSTIWRTTTGSKWQKTSASVMTRRSTDNGENASTIANSSGTSLTWNANLNNHLRLTTSPGSATTVTINNPSNLTSQFVGETFLISVLSGNSATTVNWGNQFGYYDGTMYAAMPPLVVPAQSTIGFKFRVIASSAEAVLLQFVDYLGTSGTVGYANTAPNQSSGAFTKLLIDTNDAALATIQGGSPVQVTAPNGQNVMLANAVTSTGNTFTPDVSTAALFKHTIASGTTLAFNNPTGLAAGLFAKNVRTVVKNSSTSQATIAFDTRWKMRNWVQATGVVLYPQDSVVFDWVVEFRDSFYVLVAKEDFITGGTSTAIDTIIGGYNTLRSTSGSSLSDVVYVLDWTYTYRGTSYSSIGGFFRKGSIGLSENGGTVIVANDGTRWVRIYDGNTYMPDWWEVGGKNVAGQAIGYIATDCMRIDACSRTAGQGATILFTGRVISDCDQHVGASQGQRWIGQNCTTVLRAKNVQFTRLTANANAGATSMSVADTTGFRIGQTMLLRKQRGYSLSLQNAVTITSKSAGTINFTPALSNNFTTNDTVVVVNRLIQASGTSSMKSLPITFEGIEFDCNWRSRRLVNSWSYNEVMEASSFNVYFNNCNFVNTSASCVFMGKGELNNCRFGAAATNSPATEKRMAGGLSHGSNSLITEHHTYVYRNCVSDSTNQVAPSVLGHESALFNFSSNNAYFTVDGGSYRNGGGGILWSDNNDWKFSVTGNCYFRNFTSIIRSSTAAGAANPQGDIVVDGGLYEDCGDVVFTTVDATRYRNVTVRNMRVFNGRIMLNGINQCEVHNNHFIEKRSNPAVSGFVLDLGTFASLSTYSVMYIARTSNINVTNNTFVVDSIQNGYVQHGIHITTNGMGTINSGRDYYYQNVNISGNTLRGFRYGIGTQQNTFNTAETIRRVNWTYRDNTVVTITSPNADGYGIHVAPGVVATGNVIYDMNSDANSWGLIVAGVDDSGPNETNIEGGIAYSNTILGRSGTNILIGAGTSTVNEHNALCFNNVSLTTPVNNTTSQSPNLPNIVLDATIAPTLNSYQLPLFLNFR